MKVRGLDTLIKGLDTLAKSFDARVTRKTLEKLMEYGVKRAKELLVLNDTYNTNDSIKGYIEGNTLTIVAGGAAVWLEFGTGITKAAYPETPPDDIVAHGEYDLKKGSNPQGWYFKTSDARLAVIDEKTGQPWMTKDGEYIAHTMGIDAQAFMWQTAIELEERATQYGLEVLYSEVRYI